MHLESWDLVAREKQQERQSRIPKSWIRHGIQSIKDIEENLTDAENELTRLSAWQIVEKTKSGELKVYDVVHAFCKRAALAHQLTNCLSEIRFDDALQVAKEFDASFSSTEEKGPLYGLPMTIKDMMNIKGLDSTNGYIAYCKKPATTNSGIFECLKKSGAIIISKTACVQTMMVAETVSNVWGLTVNPYNSKYIPGGSSGGEGALVACHGSATGIGTDVGGSIRLPSAANGTYGLRPAAFRFPYNHQAPPERFGAPLIKSVAGPLSNDPRDLHLIWKAMIDARPWQYDGTVFPVPYRDVGKLPKKIRVGYYKTLSDVVPHPPVLRAIDEVVAAFKTDGHDVFEIEDFPKNFQDLRDHLNVLYSIDSYKTTLQHLKDGGNEPLVEPAQKSLAPALKEHTPWDIMEAREAANRFTKAAMNVVYSELPGDFDIMLGPVMPYSAVPHNQFCCVDFTAIYNMMDLPATAVPVTRVDPAKDQPRHLDTSGKTSIAGQVESLWDPEGMAGLPVSVQLVGKKFHEEELLQATIRLADLVPFK